MDARCYVCKRTAKEVLDYVYAAEGEGSESERLKRSADEIDMLDTQISELEKKLGTDTTEKEQLGLYSDIVRKTGQVTVGGETWYDVPDDLFAKYGSWNIEKFEASKICDYPFATGERDGLEQLFSKVRPGETLADHKGRYLEESHRISVDLEEIGAEVETDRGELERTRKKREGYRPFEPYSVKFRMLRAEPVGLPPVELCLCPLCTALLMIEDEEPVYQEGIVADTEER